MAIIAALYFWGVQLCIIQLPNDQNNLIVQSNTWDESRDTFPSSLSSMLNFLLWSDKMPLLIHTIQCRIWVRPRYFINWIRPTWPGQNVTQVTQSSFNPAMYVVMYVEVYVCKGVCMYMLAIKMSGSESRGQEEAVCTHISGLRDHYSELFARMVDLNF